MEYILYFNFLSSLDFKDERFDIGAMPHMDQDQIKPLMPVSDRSRANYGIIPEHKAAEDTERRSTTATEEESESQYPVEKWNDRPINTWRILATFYSFIVLGANDGAYGVSILSDIQNAHTDNRRH